MQEPRNDNDTNTITVTAVHANDAGTKRTDTNNATAAADTGHTANHDAVNV